MVLPMRPNPLKPVLPSQRVGSFLNQSPAGLLGAPGAARGAPLGGIPMAPAMSALQRRAAPSVSVGKQNSTNIQSMVKEGNARLSALTNRARTSRTTGVSATPTTGGYQGTSFPQASASRGGNQVDISQVTKIGNQYLRKDAANSFIQMNNAFKQATGKSLGITEGWRSYDRQVQLYNLYKSGRGNLAAKPGTSTHGKGTAVDMNGMGAVGSASFNWLRQNSQKFGYSWTGGTFSQIEPWHWDFKG